MTKGQPDHVRVYITRETLHRIFASDSKHAKKVKAQFPLETRQGELLLDHRTHEETWDVSLSGA